MPSDLWFASVSIADCGTIRLLKNRVIFPKTITSTITSTAIAPVKTIMTDSMSPRLIPPSEISKICATKGHNTCAMKIPKNSHRPKPTPPNASDQISNAINIFAKGGGSMLRSSITLATFCGSNSIPRTLTPKHPLGQGDKRVQRNGRDSPIRTDRITPWRSNGRTPVAAGAARPRFTGERASPYHGA